MTNTMEWVGLTALRRALQRIPSVARQEIATGFEGSATRLVQGMRARVLVRTGRLQRSIRAQVQPDTLTIRVEALPYWTPVEYGTVSTPARPFVRPAQMQEEGRLERVGTDALARTVARTQQEPGLLTGGD